MVELWPGLYSKKMVLNDWKTIDWDIKHQNNQKYTNPELRKKPPNIIKGTSNGGAMARAVFKENGAKWLKNYWLGHKASKQSNKN